METVIDKRYELTKEQSVVETVMFRVYRALDRNENKPVRLKLLKDEFAQDGAIVNKFRECFLNYQNKIRNTSNLTKIFQISAGIGRRVYVAEEDFEGQTLEELLHKKPNLNVIELVDILEQICEGLHSLHLKHLYHYCILPRNIIVSSDNKVKLVDYGTLSIVLDDEKLLSELTKDVKEYIAPELLTLKHMEEITGTCDIYSLGKVIEKLPLPIDRAILYRATDSDPKNRYQKIRDFKAELSKMAANSGTSDSGLQIPEFPVQKASPNRPLPFSYIFPAEITGLPGAKIECLDKLPRYAYFDQEKNEFTWKPGEDQNGMHYISFKIKTYAGEQALVLPVEVKPEIVVKRVVKAKPDPEPVKVAGIRYCFSCGRKLGENYRFCSKCRQDYGTAVKQCSLRFNPQGQQFAAFCCSCGRKLDRDSNICRGCGQEFPTRKVDIVKGGDGR